MNISTLLGVVASAVIFVLSIFLALDDTSGFLDFNSALIVIGGSGAITLVCFPLEKLMTLLKIFSKRVFGLNKKDYVGMINEIGELNDAWLQSKRSFEERIAKVQNLFLRDACEVLFWAESEVPEEEMVDLLNQRADTHMERYNADAEVFRTIAKFPPAFGLIGTILGMIALLQTLGNEGAENNIGPAMAIALITTLYGVAIANMIFIPIAENLSAQNKEDDTLRRIIVEGVLLIQKGLPTGFVIEKISAQLLPSERFAKSKGSGGNSSQGKAA